MSQNLNSETSSHHTPKSLTNLLEKAETQFVERDFHNCLSNAQILLKQLTKGSANQPFLFSPYHDCVEGCLCFATVILVIEAFYELQNYEKIRTFLERHYRRICDCPYDVFIIWAQFCISEKRYEVARDDIVSVLKRTNPPLNEERYDQLVELLIFYCLHPLQLHKKAFDFLESCDLAPQKREVFLDRLRRLINSRNEEEEEEEKEDLTETAQQKELASSSSSSSASASQIAKRNGISISEPSLQRYSETEMKSDFPPREIVLPGANHGGLKTRKSTSPSSWWKRWIFVLVESHGIKKIAIVFVCFVLLLTYNKQLRIYIQNAKLYQSLQKHLKQFYSLAFSYSMGRYAQDQE